MEQDPTDPTGVRETSKSVQRATTIARNRKAAMAVDLYVEKHKPLDVVAKKCGYPDATAARVAIERYMENELREHPKSISMMRDMAGRRLENVLRSVSKKALNGDSDEHLAAVREYRGLINDWVRIYGLQAPQQVIVSNPTSDMIMEVALRIQQQGAPQLEEGDIFGDDAPDDEIRELEARSSTAKVDEDIVDAVLVGDLEQEVPVDA
jgi:hypothetical protein